ncbi:hypothetical protein JAAARDRAFT_145244 [Jaapia argillacea MUCL 33604]|uniref:Membrane anchor Opy2 N-terminal domain-containing protein n=1 Tax=Jaapia argillacea MUCL 33604 TaxID=933084 RepID=A0A067QPC9_9AGAM|nr:hypothetical protein JAAARDRAFT_145244 [Jaapia argillacea MUCL 33604]
MDHILLPRQSQACITCPDPPPCDCPANQQCFQINRSCNTCSSFKCAPLDNGSGTGSTSSSGPSSGALAGAVIGSLLFFALGIGLFVWYRRRMRKARQSSLDNEVKDTPAPAEAVLNRPDPNEKPPSVHRQSGTVRVYSPQSITTINVDPELHGATAVPGSSPYYSIRGSVQSDPFQDTHSIQTTSTGSQSTNVIPIALVTPGSPHHLTHGHSGQHGPLSPVRPNRSPELNLNLEHVNVSADSLRLTSQDGLSQRSGATGANRNSYMSSFTYASDFLNEAPTIVTPTQGAVRQVLGVVRAEVVQAPGSTGSIPTTPTSAISLQPPSGSSVSRPSIRSPLATTSFGPSDVVSEVEEDRDLSIRSDPFGDEHSPHPKSSRASPSASVATFGASYPPSTTGNDWDSRDPHGSWGKPRPVSVGTQAGSIIADIGSATRVQVGFGQLSPSYTEPAAPSSAGLASPKIMYRMTSGRLVSPQRNGAGAFEEQQKLALSQAQAHARAQGVELTRRVSGSSVLSRASTRADSILESFPFVPPSPISDRPARTPPHSPLAPQVHSGAPSSRDCDSPLPAPPNRRTLGLSTVSQSSTASTGLGSFPFHIQSTGQDLAGGPPSSYPGRQRASLDTLALTSDLSSYPLNFDQDRDSFSPSARG